MGDPSRIGTFDPELFRRYRKAKEPEKTRLLEQLFVENRPLIKILLDQFIQPGSANGKHGPNFLKGGTSGFHEIPWEDGMQEASIAFKKAMEQFDPRKASAPNKIAWYLKVKIRHELQMYMEKGHRLVRVPKDHLDQLPHIGVEGDQEVLDRLGGAEEVGFFGLEGPTEEEVAEWERTGDWPESIEEYRRRKDPRCPLDKFLDIKCRRGPKFKAPRFLVVGNYESYCREVLQVEPMGREDFYRELALRGHEETCMRHEGSPIRAIGGLRLASGYKSIGKGPVPRRPERLVPDYNRLAALLRTFSKKSAA